VQFVHCRCCGCNTIFTTIPKGWLRTDTKKSREREVFHQRKLQVQIILL